MGQAKTARRVSPRVTEAGNRRHLACLEAEQPGKEERRPVGSRRDRPRALSRSLGCPDDSGCHREALSREGTCPLERWLWGPYGELVGAAWREI